MKGVWFSSVAQSCPTLCDSMDCSTPGLPVHHWLLEIAQKSCLPHRWCHPTISSSVSPFSSFLQSFPASGSFQMSQLFVSGGQSIGASASASVLSMNIQDWFPLGLTGWIFLQSKGLLGVFSSVRVQKHRFFGAQLSLWSKSHIHTWCDNTWSYFIKIKYWKRPRCWERLNVGREGDDKGWVGWMASLTWWTRIWVSSRSWWWTGKAGVLQSMGLQKVRHDWMAELK